MLSSICASINLRRKRTAWIIDFRRVSTRRRRRRLPRFEVARYAPQLRRYARAVEAVDKRPVSLGLYFPLLEELRSWPAGTTEILSE
jgi:hypothetical protein